MFKRIAIFGGIAVVAVIVVLALTIFRTPEEASAPIESIPLAVATTEAAPTEAATEVPTEAATAEATAETTATEAATEAAATEAPTEAAAASAPQIFEISSADSQARFLIDEVLQGSPVTVVGSTDQVAGQIAIDVANPQNTQLGVIQVNARTLATDNDFRNRAIKNAILLTDQYEFITFTPSQISGLPESVTVGEAFTFQVTGDLTIKDVTKPVTFDVSVTPVSETQIEGLASLTMPYTDFELAIPDSPAVDTVADDVRLELEFVAQAAS